LRALLSVATRDGITAFARGLQGLGVELYASDGTREHLAQDGVEAKPVAELTGMAEFLDGKVKTFHPSIYAGILARRDLPEQLAELESQGIALIDLVVVNVRPFGAEIGRSLVGIDRAIEMIDVAGSALLAAAARNAAGVVALANPEYYPQVLAELKATLVRTETGKTGRRPTVMLTSGFARTFWYQFEVIPQPENTTK